MEVVNKVHEGTPSYHGPVQERPHRFIVNTARAHRTVIDAMSAAQRPALQGPYVTTMADAFARPRPALAQWQDLRSSPCRNTMPHPS